MTLHNNISVSTTNFGWEFFVTLHWMVDLISEIETLEKLLKKNRKLNFLIQVKFQIMLLLIAVQGTPSSKGVTMR